MEKHLYSELAKGEERHWWPRGRRRVLASVFDAWLPKRRLQILDVGCGTGFMLEELKRFGEVEGLETSPEARALVRERFGEGLVLHERPLPEGIPSGRTYDLVTAFDVLEHLEDPLPTVRAIHAALAPDGMFICTVPAFMLLWSRHDELNHHFRRYTAGMLREQLTAGGFDVQWSSYFNSLLFPPAAAVRIAQRLLPRRAEGEGSDLGDTPPGPLNAAMEQIFAAERHLLARTRLPFGLSVLAIAHKISLTSS